MQALQSKTNSAMRCRSARMASRPSRAVQQRVSAVAAAPKTAKPASAEMTPEVAKEIYEDMVLGRDFEDMCAQMYYRGKMFGFVHLYCGQEAVSTGVIKGALRDSDYVCSTYRDHVHALSKGVPAREVMAELFGKKTGCCRGQGGSMHMFSSKANFLGGYAFIGEGIPVGLGAAFQSKVRCTASPKLAFPVCAFWALVDACYPVQRMWYTVCCERMYSSMQCTRVFCSVPGSHTCAICGW